MIGREHRVRNSLLDAAKGRFVAWAVPADVRSTGVEMWLYTVLHSVHLYPSSIRAPSIDGGTVVEEWDMSVTDALEFLYHSRKPSNASTYRETNSCSWQAIGPLLRPLALFVRFRDLLETLDEDMTAADDNGDEWARQCPKVDENDVELW